MATGLTFPTLNPCISPYGLVVILNDFFLQIQTASTFNFDTFVNSGSFDGSQLTLTNNLGGSFNVPWMDDIFITGGSYSHGTSLITLGNSTGGTVSFSLSALTDQVNNIEVNLGNDFVTGATFDLNTSEITYTRQSGGTFTTSLSAITEELYSLSSITSFDVTTGATYDGATQSLVFTTFTGGTYSASLSALTGNRFATGLTYDSGTTFLTLSTNSGDTYSTSLSSLTNNDYVVSGTYSSGTSLLTLTTLSGNSIDVDMGDLANQVNTDDRVVSGEFNSGTSVLTLTTLSGNTIEVTGVTQEDRYIFSGQVVGVSTINFFGTGGYNFSVDVTALSTAAQSLSSGVYDGAGNIAFEASSGGTAFFVSGITHITGGTYDSANEVFNLFNSTGGTVQITGFTDNYITGGSFIASSSTIDLYDRSGNTVSVDVGALTAQTGVIAVSGGTNISTGGTQQYPIVNLDDVINLTTVNASNGNINNLTSNQVNTTNLNATSVSTTVLNSTTGYFNILSAETYYSGSTLLEIAASNIAIDSLAFVSTDNYVANIANTIVHSFSSTNVMVEVIDTNSNARIDALVSNYQSASVDITLGQSLNDVKAIIYRGGATSAYTLDTTALSATNVTSVGNVAVAGTSLNPIISLNDNVGFNDLFVSGSTNLAGLTATTADIGTLSATTISASTIYSGGTDLFDIILAFGGSGGGGSSSATAFISTDNYTAGVTQTLTHSLSSNSVVVQLIDTINNQKIDGLVDNYQDQSVDVTLSQTLNDVKAIVFASGAATAYTVSAPSIFIQNGVNTVTGGTSTEPFVSLVDSPSINNLSLSGLATMNAGSATTFSASTLWVTNISGMSPVNINGTYIVDETFNAPAFSAVVGGDSSVFKIDGSGSSRLVFDTQDQGNDFSIRYGSTELPSAIFDYGAGSFLYYAGNLRLSTTSAGGTLTNTWQTSGAFTVSTDLTVSRATDLQFLRFTGSTVRTQLVNTDLAELNAEFVEVDNNTSSLTPRSLYYLNSSGTWALADASATGTSIGFLAIPNYADSDDGMMTRGYINLETASFDSAPTIGDVIYMSETAGNFTNTPPTSLSAVVRVLGYVVDEVTAGRDTDYVLYFNPSNDWIVNVSS